MSEPLGEGAELGRNVREQLEAVAKRGALPFEGELPGEPDRTVRAPGGRG